MVYDDNGRSVSVLYDKVDEQWTNPRALSNGDLEDLMDGDENYFWFHSPEVLWYAYNRLMIWYTPPSVRDITIKKKKSKYRHPGLVFCLRRSRGRDILSVAVYSTKENRRPDINDNIYESPYAGIDVHPTGGVMGSCNVIRPRKEYAFDIGSYITWQDSFFESGFNYKPKPRNRLKQTTRTLNEWLTSTSNTD